MPWTRLIKTIYPFIFCNAFKKRVMVHIEVLKNTKKKIVIFKT